MRQCNIIKEHSIKEFKTTLEQTINKPPTQKKPSLNEKEVTQRLQRTPGIIILLMHLCQHWCPNSEVTRLVAACAASTSALTVKSMEK